MAIMHQQPKIELKIRDPVEDDWLTAPLMEITIDQRRDELPTVEIEFLESPFSKLCERLFGSHEAAHIDLSVDEQRLQGTVIVDTMNMEFESASFARKSALLLFTSLTPYKPKEKSKMSKIDNIATIANDNITTLKAMFSWSANGDKKTYTFKVMRDFAAGLKADDHVVVESKNGISVVKVISIDEFADIELESDIDYRWAFQKVDSQTLEGLLKNEGDLVEQLKRAQHRSIQENALRGLGISPDALKSLGQAPIPNDTPPPMQNATSTEPFTSTGVSGGEERVGGGVRDQE